MSVLRSQLVGEVYEYCGNPDDRPLKDGGLPQQLVFQVLVENEDEMLRDLELSNQSRRVAVQEIQLGENEFVFNLNDDASAPAYVALQTEPSSNVWWPVEIVTPDALSHASVNGLMAVAFHDTPQVGEVSWQPDSSHILRVWYERSGNDNPELAASTDLGNLYDSFLKLRTAAQCRELLGLKVGEVLASRLIYSQRQWERYVSKGLQKGLAAKSPVWTPRRFRRSFPLVDRTRFFVP